MVIGVVEVLGLSAGFWGLLLVIMLFALVFRRNGHSKSKIRGDLKKIKEQINGK